MSTHNKCFRAKIRKKCIPLYTLVLLYKSGVYIEGVYISRTCLHDVRDNLSPKRLLGTRGM